MNCWLQKTRGFDPTPILRLLSVFRTRSPRFISSIRHVAILDALSCHRVRIRQRKAPLAANLSQYAPLKLRGSSLVPALFVSSSKPPLEGFAPFGLTLRGRAGLERSKGGKPGERWSSFGRLGEWGRARSERVWEKTRGSFLTSWAPLNRWQAF